MKKPHRKKIGHVITTQDAAKAMRSGPKSAPPSFGYATPILPGSPGSGSAPGANGPPTTGAIGPPGGPLGST